MIKRITIVLLIILGVFISFSLYRTYAYNTTVVEETPSATDLEYTFKIGDSSIKEITISSGETKYYDIVLGNPNNAKISYCIYYEMVSPNTKPNGFSIEYTSKSTGDSTGKLDKNSNINLNLVVTNTSSSSVTVKLGSIAGYINGGELTLSSGQMVIPKRVTATEFINSLDDGTTGDSGSGVYKVEHDAIPASSSATGSEIPATTDYRYYGASPNNYVCLDMEGGSTCPDKHLYRIIGSIYEELSGQNLLKVIKATPLTDGTTSAFSWDYKVTDGKRSYNNIWATITSGNYSNSLTSGSTLMTLLNSGAWWNGTSGSYYNLSTTATTVNFTNYKLSDKAKSYVTTSRYYLGEESAVSKTTEMYVYERGTTRYDTSRPLYWDGNVGLMYPSDYGYAAGNTCVTGTNLYSYDEGCFRNDWINNTNKFQWFMSPNKAGYNEVYYLTSMGRVNYEDTATRTCSVSPVFYLSKDAVITGGIGTETAPYLISK